MELVNKLKRIKPAELQLGVFGIFCLTILCFFFYFFYLDVRVFGGGFRLPTKSQKRIRFGFEGFSGNHRRPDLPDGLVDGCNLFEGKWVWDERYPLYESKDCRFVDDGFRCSENGRPDNLYAKWRWQPERCNLPSFDAKTMLEKLRNRRMVFVGDSIGRNQWESLLCMLSSAVVNMDSIYEVNGSPITKHNGFLIFKFKDFNCTVEYFRAPFLVLQSRPPARAPAKVKTTLKLDMMDWTSEHWRDADVLVFNTGHWWNYEKTIRSGCYFQIGEDVKMKMSVESAYRKSIETLVDWIGKEVNLSKTQVIYRTFAPVHFRVSSVSQTKASLPLPPSVKDMFSAALKDEGSLSIDMASDRTLYPIVTGTSVIGVKYKDGVVMAADMGGSYGSTLRYKSVDRLKPIGKHSLLGGSGEISDFQEILRYLDELILYDNMWDDGNSLGPKQVHSYLNRVLYNRRNKFDPLWNSLVLGGVKNGQKYLGTVNMIGVHYEDNHVATGFGNHLARPILRNEWHEDMTFEDAVKLLEKCMLVLLYRDRSAINKLQIAKITEEGVTISQPYSLKTFWGFSSFNHPTKAAEGSW